GKSAFDAGETLSLAQNRETLKEAETYAFACCRNPKSMDDLRVTDAFGLHKILQALLDGRRVERIERCKTARILPQKTGSLGRIPQALVECSLVIGQLISRTEERRIIENVAGNLDSVRRR